MNEVVISEEGCSLQLDPLELEALLRLSTVLPGSLAQKLSMAKAPGRAAGSSRVSESGSRVTATINFHLPEDQDALEDALHATDMRCLFYDIFRDVRLAIKHGGPFLGETLAPAAGAAISDDAEKVLSALTTHLRREFSEKGIRWDL